MTDDLAEALAARLCHDLSSPLGTLLGMVELAQEEAPGEAIDLAAETARALAGRLRLLRAAWGGDGAEHDASSLAELLSHAAGAPRVRADWSGVGPGRFAAGASRLLINVALTGLEALPGGGAVRFRGAPGQQVIAQITGPRAAWPDGWIDVVAGRAPLPEPTTRTLQPALTVLAAQAAGVRLEWLVELGEAPPALMISI